MSLRRKILVINPNSNDTVTQGLAEALKSLTFADGPQIDCMTLTEGPFGVETQADSDSVAIPLLRVIETNNTADAFVIAC